MMSFLKRLAVLELVSQLALGACAVLFALVFVLAGQWGSMSVTAAADSVAASARLALIVYVSGFMSVALVGAPIYTILEAKRLMTPFAAVLVGALPGVILLSVSWISSMSMASAIRLQISPEYALIYIVLGMAVGATTHLVRTWKAGVALPPDISLARTHDR